MFVMVESRPQQKCKVMVPGYPKLDLKSEPWPGVKAEGKQKESQWAQTTPPSLECWREVL